MRVIVAAVLPLIALAPLASAMDEEFEEFRLGLGVVSGFDRERVTHSELAGGADPANNHATSLSGKAGFDFQPGLWLGSSLDQGIGLVFGAAVVLRTPGATAESTTDTGVANGAGSGNVLLQERSRISTQMFGGKLSAGVTYLAGPVRLELTPFIGVGALRARFLESRVYTNDPNGLLTPQDSNASFSNTGSYVEYGLSLGAFMPAKEWLNLGLTAGWQGVRAVVHVDQHGPFMDASDRVLMMRAGLFVDGVAGITF